VETVIVGIGDIHAYRFAINRNAIMTVIPILFNIKIPYKIVSMRFCFCSRNARVVIAKISKLLQFYNVYIVAESAGSFHSRIARLPRSCKWSVEKFKLPTLFSPLWQSIYNIHVVILCYTVIICVYTNWRIFF